MRITLCKGIDDEFFKALKNLYSPLLSTNHLRDRYQYTIFNSEYPFPIGIASLGGGPSRFMQFALLPELRGKGLGHAVLDELIKVTGVTRVDWGCRSINYPSLRVLQERNGGLLEGSVKRRNSKSYEGFFRVNGEVASKMQKALTSVLPLAKEQYLEWLRNDYSTRSKERLLLKKYLASHVKIVDSHFHLHPDVPFDSPDPITCRFRRFVSHEQLLEEMDKSGIRQVIIFGMPSFEDDNSIVNKSILRFCALAPTRLIPFAILYDTLDVSEAVAQGFRGFKEHVYGQRILRNRNGLPGLATAHRKRLYCQIAEHRLPVLTHMGPNVVERVTDILRSSPELILIVAHLGMSFSTPITWGEVKDVLDRLRKYPSVYFDVAAIDDIRVVEASVAALGANRLLWGSDWPLEPQARSLERILMSDSINMLQLYALLCGNVVSLLSTSV